MDSLRGQDEMEASGVYDEAIEAPPVISGSERRMQVRAYNYWVSLLGNRSFPSIEDLNPEEMEDFGANSVLLDFSLGLENPAVIYLGSALREECGIDGVIERIDQVPARSLLSRLTDHYLQIIANAAPVGFEAEFTNQRGVEIMYRGILMPFSSNDETIDFIYGVINWKEAVSQSVLDSLGEEIRAALSSPVPSRSGKAPIWSEASSVTADFDFDDGEGEDEDEEDADSLFIDAADDAEELAELDLASYAIDDIPESGSDGPELMLTDDLAAPREEAAGDIPGEMLEELPDLPAEPAEMDLIDEVAEEAPPVAAMPQPEDALAAQLLLARQSAAEAGACDVRSHASLYRAIGNAYDFALQSRDAPEAYAAMLKDAEISVQARSPNTAVIKLVFGADHDKTRIAEYACALDYAFARNLASGALSGHLLSHDGGLKGLVRDIRAERRAEKAVDRAARPTRPIDRAVQRLSDAHAVEAGALPFDEHGLAVVIARREADGEVAFVAGIDMEAPAAQKILIEASKGV